MKLLPLALCMFVGGSAISSPSSVNAEENDEKNIVRLSVGCGSETYPAGDTIPMSNSSKGYEIIVACKDGLISRIFIKGLPQPQAVEVCNPTPRCFAAPVTQGYVAGKFMWGETIIFRIPNLVTPK
jgi:hypothetical protein